MATLTMEQFEIKLSRWIRKMPKTVQSALQAGAELVRTEVITKHMIPPKMPVGIGSMTSATLHPRSGDLRSSILAKSGIRRGVAFGRISSGMVYAAAHEYGYPPRNLPVRSFLRSSLMAKRQAAVKLILKRMMSEYKKSG